MKIKSIVLFIALVVFSESAMGANNFICRFLFGTTEAVTIHTANDFEDFKSEIISRGTMSFSEAISIPFFLLKDPEQKKAYLNWVSNVSQNTQVYTGSSHKLLDPRAWLNDYFTNHIVWKPFRVYAESDMIFGVWEAIDKLSSTQLSKLRRGALLQHLSQQVLWKSLILETQPRPELFARDANGVVMDHLRWLMQKFSMGLVGGSSFWIGSDPDRSLIEPALSGDIARMTRILSRRYSLASNVDNAIYLTTRAILVGVIAAVTAISPEAVQTSLMQYRIDAAPVPKELVSVWSDSKKTDAELRKDLIGSIQTAKKEKLTPEQREVLKTLELALELNTSLEQK